LSWVKFNNYEEHIYIERERERERERGLAPPGAEVRGGKQGPGPPLKTF